jgi:hypothetical protein
LSTLHVTFSDPKFIVQQKRQQIVSESDSRKMSGVTARYLLIIIVINHRWHIKKLGIPPLTEMTIE